MKLLKKIAPFAISALMIGATLGGAFALNIADWKTQFKSSNTAVVVGSMDNLDAGDVAAAFTLATDVGIDTSTSGGTVTGDSYKFEKTNDKLNLLDTLSGMKPTITDTQLKVVLADGTYTDDNGDDHKYTQKITMEDDLTLEHFSNDDYNDGVPSLGFDLASGTPILEYVLDFTDAPDYTEGALKTTTINMLGKTYYINALDDTPSITLLDSGTTKTIAQGQSANVNGKNVQVVGVYDNGDAYEAVLNVDGTETKALEEGDTQKLTGGIYVGVIDIRFDPKETGQSSVEVSIGSGEIVITDGDTVQINDKDVDGLTAVVDTGIGTTLESITLDWELDDDAQMSTGDELVLPGLESIKLMMSGMTEPTGEDIGIDVSSTRAELDVELASGEKTIPILDSDGADTWDYLGKKSNDASTLITAVSTGGGADTIDLEKDNYFVTTYVKDEEGESYYLKVTGFDDDDDTVTITDQIDTDNTCTIALNEECQFGSLGVDVKATTLDSAGETVTLTAAEDNYFDRLVTVEGALFYLPLDGDLGGATYPLVMAEEDNDGNIAPLAGATATFTYGFSDNDKASVKAVDASLWASEGDEMLSVDDDTDEGYIGSDLGTKITYNYGGDEDSAVVHYWGSEIYGNVYLAGSGATSGSSWSAVKDTETGMYKTQNIVIIGGTAVNSVAREFLGLDAATPVYGTESGWLDNTDVDAQGKGILWIKNSPYTEGAGKYAILVAGYVGSDTETTANFLDLKAGTLAKDKAVINTVTNAEEA
jgi:hypothetical protein